MQEYYSLSILRLQLHTLMLCTAFILYSTLGIAVAAEVRSFSKLKMIQSNLRGTTAEEWLGETESVVCPIISIENMRARKLNLEEVIEKFAQNEGPKS